MSEILVVKDKIQRILTDLFNSVQVTDSGFSVEIESTKCFVDVHQLSNPEDVAWRKKNDYPTINISVWAIVSIGVKSSSEMFEWIATEGQSYDYGATRAVRRDDGMYNVLFQYRFVGETSDPMEIRNAVMAVCTTADNLDDEFTKKFGGETYAE